MGASHTVGLICRPGRPASTVAPGHRHPRADELSHVATLLESMSTWTHTPGLTLIGDGYSRSEVERELGVPVMATLPDDPRGAAILCGQSRGRAPDRSALGRAAARLDRTLLGHLQAGHPDADGLMATAAPTGKV